VKKPNFSDNTWLEYVKYHRNCALQQIKNEGYTFSELLKPKHQTNSDKLPLSVALCATYVKLSDLALSGRKQSDPDFVAKAAYQLGLYKQLIVIATTLGEEMRMVYRNLGGVDDSFPTEESDLFGGLLILQIQSMRDRQRKERAKAGRKAQAQEAASDREIRDEHICNLGKVLQKKYFIPNRNLTNQLIEHCNRGKLWEKYGVDPSGLSYPTVRKILLKGGVLE
jgi:hypothetical protein